MVVMAISGSVYAQDVVWDFYYDSSNGNPGTKDGVTVYAQYWTGSSANLYSGDLTGTEYGFVKVTSDTPISKIVFHGSTDNGMQTLICSTGNFTSLGTSESTWEGSATEIIFNSTSDVYAQSIDIYFESGPVEPVDYTINISGMPETGASVSLDGQNYTTNGTHNYNDVTKKLGVSNLTYTAPEGYEATTEYDATTHTFTVTFSRIEYIEFITSGLTEGNMQTHTETKSGVTINGKLYSQCINLWSSQTLTVSSTAGNIVKIELTERDGKTINASVNTGNFVSNTWTGSATSVTFTPGNDEYVTKIRVYLEAVEPIEYTVNVVNAPAGAVVKLGDTDVTTGGKFTITANYSTDAITATEPTGYYAEKSYDEATHTFTVTYKQYLVYTVHVSGHPMGALYYDGTYYENGQTIQAKEALTKDDVTLYDLNGYKENIRIDGNDIYGTYTEQKIHIGASGYTTFACDTPFILDAAATPYLVTGAEDGEVTMQAIEAGGSSSEDVTATFDGTTTITDSNITDGFLNINYPGVQTFQYGSTWEFMSYDYYYKDINVTFTVPEGSTINKISIQEDYGYTFPTWPDGTKGMTYSPATPTNEVVLKMGHPGSYAYFYGITVEYTKVSGTVNAFPAGAGILVQGTPNSDVPYTVAAAGTVDMTGNLLWGCLEDQTKDAGSDYIYKLSLNADNDEGSIGFYWGYEGGHKVDAHAGKAYLVLSAQGAKANGFRLDGTTTGIESLIQGTESAPVFNLNGQRMNTTNLPAGVYVKNGRKFIVK